jgi:hypothetical protein
MFLGSLLPSHPQTIVDIGSGAGFPGVPIAVLRPDCSVTLIESHQRKAVFLAEACADVPSVTVICGRAEGIQGQYDWLVSRAVSPEPLFSLSLARSMAILTSQTDLRQLPESIQVIPVPWGHQRVAALFHVEHQSAKI